MAGASNFRLQLVVFALVSASFTNIYISQPVLPVLQREFAADMVLVSLSVSSVILGIALANLPFGFLVDRLPIQPLILAGGSLVAFGGIICAVTENFWILIGARFLQGIFIPALTTCLAAYLSKQLPESSLNVVMGSWVSATVLGGMGGRLLGGWVHSISHWRFAFAAAAVLILVVTMIAWRALPRTPREERRKEKSAGYFKLIKRWDLLRLYVCAAGSFGIFSSVFNFLPFRLTAAPFNFSTELTTMLYCAYIVGIFIGPIAGKIGDRFGSANALLAGIIFMGGSLALLSLPSISAVVFGLLGICAGFFTVHSAAIGSLNRRLTRDQGRANALYVLCYYLGGWLGITFSGITLELGEWRTVIYFWGILLLIPIAAGIGERSAVNPPRRAKKP
jgi:YNFM family putative membrane transporter